MHINRALREAGLIRVRVEMGREMLDAGALARVRARRPPGRARLRAAWRSRVAEVQGAARGLDGVERVLDEEGKRAFGLDHPRSGELVAIAAPDRWFSYYYWLDDARAPDFARTVDIHRKPGYDPVELFVDPAIRFPPARDRLAAAQAQARLAHAAGRDLAQGHAAGQRLARAASPTIRTMGRW